MASKKMDISSLGDIPERVKKKYHNGKSDWIGVQEEDTNPILYLSGTAGSKEWDERDFKKATGCVYRCFSYAYCGIGSPLTQRRHVRALDWCLNNGVRVFLDSGAHTFHKLMFFGSNPALMGKGTDHGQRVNKAEELASRYLSNYSSYVKWCYLNNKHFDFYVTLDWKKKCSAIYDVTESLFKEHGIHPVPVYHGDSPLYWVEKYIGEGHRVIGIGYDANTKTSNDQLRRYYSTIFDLTERHNVKLHGFAVTGDFMFEFPWYSVDSTTWLKAAAFGKILDIRPEKQRVALIHISSRYSDRTSYGAVEGLSKEVRKALREQVEADGFEFDRIRTDLCYRATYNAKILVRAVSQHSKKRLKWESWKPLV